MDPKDYSPEDIQRIAMAAKLGYPTCPDCHGWNVDRASIKTASGEGFDSFLCFDCQVFYEQSSKDTGIDPMDAWRARSLTPRTPQMEQADRVIDVSAAYIHLALIDKLPSLTREEWNLTIPHAVDLVYRFDGYSPDAAVRFKVHLELIDVVQKDEPGEGHP